MVPTPEPRLRTGKDAAPRAREDLGRAAPGRAPEGWEQEGDGGKGADNNNSNTNNKTKLRKQNSYVKHEFGYLFREICFIT